MPEYLQMYTKVYSQNTNTPKRLRSSPGVSIIRQNLRCYNRDPVAYKLLSWALRCRIPQSPPYSIRESWAIFLHKIEANAHSAPK
jgi:hypothetical protein